jgi:ABC-type sugar transport system substrate-binding protein
MTTRRLLLMAALAAAVAAGPALAADDTLTGTLVSVEDDGREFTIQTSEGKRHVFDAPPSMDLEGVEPGTVLQVTAEPITDVARGGRGRATAIAVLPPDAERTEHDGSLLPGGGPPSGGIPSGGVPSGGAPGAGGVTP